MKTFAIDFESFYSKEIGINELGVWHYLRHELVDIYMLTVVGDDGYEYVGRPENFDWSALHGNRVLAHNYSFDGAIVALLRERDVIPEIVQFAEEHCTADLSAFCMGPRALKNASSFWLQASLSKDTRDKMKGRQWADLSESDQQELIDYALADSRYCLKLWQLLESRWPEWEREVSRINREVGWNGIDIDVPKLDRYIAKLEGVVAEAEAAIPWAQEAAPLSPIQVKLYCKAAGIPAPKSMAKDSEEFAAWLDKHGESQPWAAAMSRYRSANALMQKLKTLRSHVRPSGRAGTAWLYFGASTGRFSGAGKVNHQNWSRDAMFGDIEPRSVLLPGEGNVFVACDLAQIEVRVLHWLAAHLSLGAGESGRTLQLLREGFNPYEAAARIFKVWDGEKGTLKKTNKALYQMVKGQTLGCGYGIGPNKFFITAPLLTGGDYTPTMEEATDAVAKYRDANTDVVKMWWHLQRQLELAASKQEDYRIDLPSGRAIIYRNARYVAGDFKSEVMVDLPRNGKIMGLRIYGGLVAENVSQALAREVFAWHMKEVAAAGYDIAMHTHDEVVVRVPKEHGEAAVAELEALMSIAPPWIGDIPLGAEAEVMEVYRK